MKPDSMGLRGRPLIQAPVAFLGGGVALGEAAAGGRSAGPGP